MRMQLQRCLLFNRRWDRHTSRLRHSMQLESAAQMHLAVGTSDKHHRAMGIQQTDILYPLEWPVLLSALSLSSDAPAAACDMPVEAPLKLPHTQVLGSIQNIPEC